MRAHPTWENEFAFLVVDGLSIREDALTAALAPGLGPVPLFGGSAGDGTRFERTLVIHGAEAQENAAVLAMVRTDCRARVFSLDHLRPTERRMVVTEADPARRLVRQINAEPAAREYARLLGMDPLQLTPSPLPPIRWWCASAASTMCAPSSVSRRTAIWCSFRPSTKAWC